MLKLIITLILAIPFAAHAQAFAVSKVTSLSSAAEVITVQAPLAANVRNLKVVAFKSFDIVCSVACTLTLERDGTAATTTALTIVKLNSESPGSTALAYSASDAGVGTVLAQYSLAAGQLAVVNLAGKELRSGQQNLTIRTSAITGSTYINLQWNEQ